MIRFRHLLVLTFLAASCGEREKKESAAAAPEEKASRKERPLSREAAEPDSKLALRESYDAALQEKDAAVREHAMEQIAWDGIDVDTELAREAFEALPPDSEASRRLVAHFAGRLADSDPDQAIEWARTLEQDLERAEAFGRISVVISAKDPARGAALVLAEMPAGSPRDRAVVQVIQRWSQASPPEAAEWTAALPAGAARSAGLKTAVAAWSETDPSALASWVEGRKDAAIRMECLLAVSGVLRGTSGEDRAARLGAFHDPEIRRMIENLLAQSRP